MRSRSSPASRASANGALRAAHAGSAAHDARVNHEDRDDHDDHEAASVEPYDSISESAAMNHAEAHRMSGHEGHARHSRLDGDGDGDENAGINRHGSHAAAEIQHEPLSPDDPLAPLPFNPYKGNRGLTRAWHAMKNSLAGFRVAIREESAFRQELTLAAILLPCGVLVPVEPVSRVLLLGSVLLVLIVELLNSSVEAAIDRISLERHELSRRAKDLGSAAVMVALGMCVMTWGLIVGPLGVDWVKAWL
jgi:diacylglycerol kinase (ATP)